MNRDALNKLADAIEVGDSQSKLWLAAFNTVDQVKLAIDAYNGSLDAAMALHNAVLPGWRWNLWAVGGATVWSDVRDAYLSDTSDPARAWLLAIVRALAAMPEKEAR